MPYSAIFLLKLTRDIALTRVSLINQILRNPKRVSSLTLISSVVCRAPAIHRYVMSWSLGKSEAAPLCSWAHRAGIIIGGPRHE